MVCKVAPGLLVFKEQLEHRGLQARKAQKVHKAQKD